MQTETIERVETQGLALLEPKNAVAVLTDEKRFDEFVARVEAEVEAHVPDTSTDKGRKAIASLAYKVAQTKTALDAAGKALTEDKRREIATVDAARRKIRERLDEVKDRARAPLDAWERAEAERKRLVGEALAEIHKAGRVSFDDTAGAVLGRIARLDGLKIDAGMFGADAENLLAARNAAVRNLTDAVDRLKREAAERAELERLRAEKAEREAAERAEQEAEAARQREAQAKADAEQRQKEADERAEKAAREKVRLEAEEAERKRQAEHRAALYRAAEAERAAEAARVRLEKEAADKAAAETAAKAAEAEAERKRQADHEHRARVISEVAVAIAETAQISGAKAQTIAAAIAGGTVPHLSINF